MPRRFVLLDTSFLVALENRRDPHHERAKLLDRELLSEGALSVLHWGILLEIADGFARVDRRAKGLAIIDRLEHEVRYQVYPLTAPLMDEALVLCRGRVDKDRSLTDCISFVLMTQGAIHEALTADVHFRQAGFRPLLLEP